MLKTFKLELVNEDGKLDRVIYTQEEGKEQAIEKEMDKLFLRDWRAHGRVEKVNAIEC